MPKELVKNLNENPNVEKAAERTVTFTEEFRRKAYEEYCRGKAIAPDHSSAVIDTPPVACVIILCEKLTGGAHGAAARN